MMLHDPSAKPSIHWIKQAEACAKDFDFFGYCEHMESAMLAVRKELYSAYNGRIPLAAFHTAVTHQLDHDCDHHIDIKRDGLDSGRIASKALRWQHEGYSWKEAALELLQDKFPELEGLGRDKNRLQR